jgi:ribosome-associated protein
MEQKLLIAPGTEIPLSELLFRFSRSSGAGGQNVNKVSTRVELLFDVGGSAFLNSRQKEVIAMRLKSRIGADGFLRLSTQESRSQWRNRELVIRKFVALVSKSLKPIAPRTPTKATNASRHRRLVSKKMISRKKENRKRPEPE